ncbi:hypothetical protein QJQ45_005780 [Haematococcus lacustris]|nr:hypothetical protein QJQ45_005780 [Haematococcus lacustris]
MKSFIKDSGAGAFETGTNLPVSSSKASFVQFLDSAYTPSTSPDLLSFWENLQQAPEEPPAASDDATELPPFLRDVLSELRTAAASEAPLADMGATDSLRQQAQQWFDDLVECDRHTSPPRAGSLLGAVLAPTSTLPVAVPGSMGVGVESVGTAVVNSSGRVLLSSPPGAGGSLGQLAGLLRLQVLDTLVQLVGVRQGLQAVVFNYWNATYQRYAGYADEARAAFGFDSSGGLTDQLLARFRDITGTVCTDAAFIPPVQRGATLIGTPATTHPERTGVTFTISLGNCQLSRAVSQTQSNLLLRCLLPQEQLSVIQPRYGAEFTTAVAFRGAVCRRQYTYGTQSSTRIELWNPRDFFIPPNTTAGADATAGLGSGQVLSRIRQNTAKVQQVLSDLRASLSLAVTQTPTEWQRVTQRLRDRFVASGLGSQVLETTSDALGDASNLLAGRKATRQQALTDLSAVFPDMMKWKVGEGVQQVFDAVLQHGLFSTLYANKADAAPAAAAGLGLFSRSRPLGQMLSRVVLGGRGAGWAAQGQSAAGFGDAGVEAPSETDDEVAGRDIFQRMAAEMHRILVARALAEEDAITARATSAGPTNSQGRRVPAGTARATQGFSDVDAPAGDRSEPGQATAALAAAVSTIGRMPSWFKAAAKAAVVPSSAEVVLRSTAPLVAAATMATAKTSVRAHGSMGLSSKSHPYRRKGGHAARCACCATCTPAGSTGWVEIHVEGEAAFYSSGRSHTAIGQVTAMMYEVIRACSNLEPQQVPLAHRSCAEAAAAAHAVCQRLRGQEPASQLQPMPRLSSTPTQAPAQPGPAHAPCPHHLPDQPPSHPSQLQGSSQHHPALPALLHSPGLSILTRPATNPVTSPAVEQQPIIHTTEEQDEQTMPPSMPKQQQDWATARSIAAEVLQQIQHVPTLLRLLRSQPDSKVMLQLSTLQDAEVFREHREAVKAGKDGKVVISCDWSEKLTVERSVEIMSEHWHAQQIGILVACAYFKNKEGAYKEHTVYVMTDGKEQSAAITQAAVNQVVCYLLAKHDMDMRQLYMWSDGCAGQFKGAPAMRQHFGMAQRFSMPVWWSYGATAHFKGRHDSEGGVVKQWLRGEILADRVGKCNALGFVQHCNAYHKPAAAADPSKAHRARASVGHRWCLELSTREVELCSAPQRDAHAFASSIPGSMSMHSCFFPAAGIHVEWSETACACAQCMTPAPRGVCMRPTITKPFVAMPMFDQKRDDKHWDDECLTLLCSFAPDSVKQLCTLGKKLSVKMLNEYCKAVGLYVPVGTLRADLRYMVLEHLNGQAEWD